MNRRTLLLAGLAAYGLWIPPARAQSQGKVWRVGFLAARRVSSIHADPMFGAFPQGMRELGYIEGRNLVIEVRIAESAEGLEPLAAALVALPVDVIVAAGGTAVRAAQKASRKIPIVIGTAGDPVGSGFVKSLARPGGNITGLSDVAADMGTKLLDVLLTAAPKAKQIAVLVNPGNPSHATYLKSIQEGARSAGASIAPLMAAAEAEIEGAFSTMGKQKTDALIALPDPVFIRLQRRIAELAAKHRLPCVSGFRQYVHAGGLMNYGPDFAHNFRRAATYVDKIFKGAHPAELPVEQSTRFELAVNLKTAKALGLTIPSSLLVRADEVLQ